MTAGSISVVVPTYNVAAFLPEFLTSLDNQRIALDKIELIFVDDGSTDDSDGIIRAWIARTATPNSRIVTKPNGGLSSARNAGLDVATGTWVTFCDPDDVLSPDYLAIMWRFVRSKKARTVHLVAGRFVYLDDKTATVSDTHPLRFRFSEGTRIIDLERHPHFVHVAANTALYRRSVLDKHGLRFDERVRPVWEDGHLTGRYLAKFDRPRIALMSDARYLYRRRADGSSLMQGSWADPSKYLDVPRHGWLDLLRTITEERGTVPQWAQNLVLYDMLGYFRRDSRSPSPTAGLPPDVTESFHETLREVVAYLDAETIEGFRVTRVPLEIRRAVLVGAKGLQPRPSEAAVDRLDPDRRIVRLRYYYSGRLPDEQFRARGFVVRPVYAKVRAVRFFGRTMMYERTAWLPATGALSLQLDGTPVPMRLGAPEARRYLIGSTAIWAALGSDAGPVDIPASAPLSTAARPGLRPLVGRWRRDLRAWVAKFDVGAAGERMADAATRRMARSAFARRRYGKGWLLIDRDTDAQDNAEHLYRYLRDEQPQVNARFVLARDSRDWTRLRRDGFRLIAHGSRRHVIALLNCQHLLSSQIDHYIVRPLDPRRFGTGSWHYTFLQHGVTKDDLSTWINSKPMSLMITATLDEHESIVGDGSTYAFSGREVRLTGFPRHDRLSSLASKQDPVDVRLILIMPTWRRELLGDPVAGGNERKLRADFWESRYATEWCTVLESEQLQKAAAARGWEIAFIPHPNMQGYLDQNPLPSHVQVHRFRDIDIQEMLARGAVLVTDYSSLAFETAYLERPVVYFQFDHDTFFNGGHAYRRGTWSYEDDGFGPVTVCAEAAVDALIAIAERDGVAEPVYVERMRSAFPFRDGECSRRTYEAVCDITRALSYSELYLRLEPRQVLAGAPVEGRIPDA